jgi:hypothetical protein
MEPTPSAATLIDPASVPSAAAGAGVPAVPHRAAAAAPLPPQAFWTAVILAAVLPAILLLTLLSFVWSANFSVFGWME